MKSTKSAYQSSKIFDLNVFGSSFDRLLGFLHQHINSGKSLLSVVTPNPEQIVLSRKNSTFLHHLQSAELCLPDGVGLVWASRWCALWGVASPVSERITGVDLMETLLSIDERTSSATSTARSLIIGGRLDRNVPSTSTKLIRPNLFWTPGFESVQHPSAAESQALEENVAKIRPKIVFIAFGAPSQEAFLHAWHDRLEQVGCRVVIVVGGAPDVLFGSISRAPHTIQQLGLEWLYRLWQEPWRWRRQLSLIVFLGLALAEPLRLWRERSANLH